MPLLTQYPPTKYSDVEAKLLIMIERSLDCNVRTTIRPEIDNIPSPLLPEYVASMLRSFMDQHSYAKPEWDEETREWKVGDRIYKSKPKASK
ncbi:MAG: hypothetical protein E6Q68_07500 [Polynucleobacter sp.]|nr:MAG: hypothetical protein E6Q68_07500 [Polynucleobacter sp.]